MDFFRSPPLMQISVARENLVQAVQNALSHGCSVTDIRDQFEGLEFRLECEIRLVKGM